MSGRDFKTFLASHKTQIGQQDSKLVTRFLSGQKPLYKPIDYGKVAALSKIKHASASRSLKKVEKLQKQNKQCKNEQLLQEHRRVWESEMHKLRVAEDKLQDEIKSLRPTSPNFERSTTLVEEMYEEILDLQDSLRLDLKQFVKSTIKPIHELREDLQEWLKENRSQLAVGFHNDKKENEILESINSVKEQQAHILMKLDKEQSELEYDSLKDFDSELCTDGESSYRSDSKLSRAYSYGSSIYGSVANLPTITIGIPERVTELECPDESLQVACYEEFDSLDEKYTIAIEVLEEKYNDVITRKSTINWEDVDCLQFKHILEQYRSVSKNRRKLYIDRLKREMPHKTIKDIKGFEEFWFRSKSLQNQLRSLFHAWRRDREDLILRVISLFDEATVQYQDHNKSIVEHMKQKFVCNFLHEKLLEYHTERLELMTLEAAQQARQEEDEEQRRKVKEEKVAERRMEDKRKILLHKERQELQTVRIRDVNKLRMLELQEKRAEQRAFDMERVDYRNQVLGHKQKMKQLEKLQIEEKRFEKEKKIQRMTEQINATVDYDPLRILEPTKTFLARTAVVEDEELIAQEPLFNVYTYTVDQVAQDKRVKIENALRRANLHMTDYGRQILSGAPPPSKPRKDMQSTILK